MLRTHCCSWLFLCCANREAFVADTKCFWKKSDRNIFVSRTQILCPQQMLRARANGETFVSTTWRPRLPPPLHPIYSTSNLQLTQQSPNLTGPPARGSSATLMMRIALYKSCSTLFLPCGRHFLRLVLVLSLFSSYNVIKSLFLFIILANVINLWISRYILARCWLHVGFLEKLVLNAIIRR